MTEPLRAELTLPNDARLLRLCREFVQQMAGLGGLPEEQVGALVRAADEACTNVIEHAFEPGERGTFTLCGEVATSGFTLSIRDQGLPFDASLAPRFQRLPGAGKGLEAGAASLRGMGLYLIRQAVDEVRWVNLGKAGKELRLFKRRPQVDVTEQLPEADLTRFHDEEPLAPAQEYTVRRLRPDDAIAVAQCIYRAYGYTYLNEDLYYPERIREQNESGELVSVVAEGADGQVVGHYALERPDLGRVAELGQAVVMPAHRGRKLMERMRGLLVDEARRLGLVGLFSQPVTSHTFSQRVNEGFGSRPCGVTLGLAPRSLAFRKIRTEPLPQRESTMLYFQYLSRPAPAVVHLPEEHREIARRIYSALDAPVELREGAAPEGAGAATVRFSRAAGLGLVRVDRVGRDSAAEVRRAREDLCSAAGAELVLLELPLAQPGTPDLCRAAEAAGFFFGGIGPSFAPDGDVLRLLYLHTDLDETRLQVLSPLGQEIVAYTAAERAARSRAQ